MFSLGIMNTRVIAPKRHIARMWESNPYWQSVLAKHPERSPLYEPLDELTAEHLSAMPERLKMPTTRTGLNAMRMQFRKALVKRNTKSVRSERFWRHLLSGSVLGDGADE